MNFEPFELERLLSDWEQTVEFNFAESGVHPVSLGELLQLSDIDIKEFLETPLNYPEVNGEASLRKKIAGFYDGAKLENILVTVGASEANYIIANTLLKKGDEIAVMQPTYKQFSGAAKNLGVKVNSFSLEAGNNWALNRQELLDAVKRYVDSCNDRRVTTIEYILINNVNDGLDHAEELSELLRQIPCKVNLIPFNQFEGSDYLKPSGNRIKKFQSFLQEKGYVTTIRSTRGDDIMAACGQLVGQVNDRTRRQERSFKNQIKTKAL